MVPRVTESQQGVYCALPRARSTLGSRTFPGEHDGVRSPGGHWRGHLDVHFPAVHLFPPKCKLPKAGAGGTHILVPGPQHTESDFQKA